MKNSIIHIAFLILGSLIGCSTSTDGDNAVPEINYSQATYNTSFYNEGEIGAPITNWRGDPGSYGLESAIKGISIHPKTGTISWDRTLPLGTNHITVIAFNNSGVSRSEILIENRFVGKFQGFFDIIVSIDGVPAPETFCFESNGTTTFIPILDFPYEGSWTIVQNNLTAEYPPRENLGRPLVLKAKVTHTKTEAYITGRFGKDPEDPEKSSAFHMDLVEQQ